MTLLTFERAHALGLERAREVAQRIGDEMMQGYKVESVWDGNALRFSRTGLTGVLTVFGDRVHLEARLGVLLSIYKARIAADLDRNFDRYFGGSAGESQC